MYELVPTYPLKKPRQKHLWIKAFTGSSKLLINQTNSVSMIQLSCAFRIDRCLSLNCDWHHWTQLFVTPPSPPPPPRPQPWEPRSSLVAQTVKNLPAIQETQVWSLGWENPLEEGMTTLLQYSCMENSMDRGVWQASVHRIARVGIQPTN